MPRLFPARSDLEAAAGVSVGSCLPALGAERRGSSLALDRQHGQVTEPGAGRRRPDDALWPLSSLS